MKKLAIITTHPVQYYAPVFKLLHERQQISINVFYTGGKATADNYDYGFKQNITWDIPLLEGYLYQWVENTSVKPGSHHFNGVVNPGLIDQLQQYDPDAILVIGWAYDSHLRVICNLKNKVPVLFRGDSTLLDNSGVRSALKFFLLRWVYRHVDHAFFNGKNNEAYFKKHGFKDKQLSFAPHAIDNSRFLAGRTNEVQSFKESLGLTADDILVLFAGKLEEKKDPCLLLKAFIKLNDAKVHLLFAGSGMLEDNLKLQAKAHKNIHFAGFINQSFMPVIYQACDLFCLPSKGPGESWGLAVNEAMACNKAVLVSNKCGCAVDLVEDNKNGFIFKSGNTSDLLQALRTLTANKQILEKFGKFSGMKIKAWDFLNIAKAIENKLLNEAH